MLKILKALTFTKWDKKKELIVSTFKAITCPILEYVNTMWNPIIKCQCQETAHHLKHRFANCYRLHTRYTQPLHNETKVLPMDTHLKLHAT